MHFFAQESLGAEGPMIVLLLFLLGLGFILLTAAIGAVFRSSTAAAFSLWATLMLALLHFSFFWYRWAGLPPRLAPREVEARLKQDPDWEDPRDSTMNELAPFGVFLIFWSAPTAAAVFSYRAASAGPAPVYADAADPEPPP